MDINKISNTNFETVKNVRPVPVKGEVRNEKIESAPNEGTAISKENLNNIVDTLNSAAKSVHQRVSFSYNEDINRIIMKVTNTKTSEVVREIPPKEMIRILEHIHDMLGVFVDESR